MRVLLLNQCFHPDVVSTAQHLSDLAVELARRGHAVTVVASARGYDNPDIRFPKREQWNGVNIIRIPNLGLGKQAKWRRALNFGSYLLSCVLRLAVLPRFDVVVALTSPPLISFLGALFVRFKGGRFVFWVMDLNPDEAVAAGWLRAGSSIEKLLTKMLVYSLKKADYVIALDRFMRERVVAKGISAEIVAVLPPWSHDEAVSFDAAGRAAFRARHELGDQFVVMYAGNHSPCHPLDTLLAAAQQLAEHKEIVFCFMGGGSGFEQVQTFVCDHRLTNVRCLPYQPLAQLAGALSAADLQVVVMGEAFRGISHPCKIYNVLKIGTPFLVIGPVLSHLGDIVAGGGGRQAHLFGHGEAAAVAACILKASVEHRDHPVTDGSLGARFSKASLLPQMMALLERQTSQVQPDA